MIDYMLKQNDLSGAEPNKYRAIVINGRTCSFEDIANRLIQKDTGLSRSVIVGLWDGIMHTVEEMISEGILINTDLFRVHFSIRGAFNDQKDKFDKSRHEVRLNLSPGPLLSKTPEKLKVKKHAFRTLSYINSVTDVKTGSEDKSLTPGSVVRISGKRLKISGTEPVCGLYFMPEKPNEQPVKVTTSDIVMNNPSEVIAVIPKLGKGNWKLRLVTQYCAGKKCLKEPQEIIFGKALNVS